jgi:hypothetical protein
MRNSGGLNAKLDVDPASTSSPGHSEREILKAKRGKSASPVDAEHPEEVERLKAKLARSEAATDTKTPDVLKTKSVERGASSAKKPADQLEILKAKRHKAAPVDVERPGQVETLKAKLVGDGAATDAETAIGKALEAKSIEGDARPKTSPSQAAGVASAGARRDLPASAASDEPERRGRSAFDLAFVLVLGLWGIAFIQALMTGAHWWLFVLCTAATAGVTLFGLLDSTWFKKEFGQMQPAVLLRKRRGRA